ncbi:hypothetical protein LZP81_30785 [Streptomyces parvulus]|uniref:hypothetical protein n=1 Tax=Streptomyces parvulus TaxID=146923 RepID=UPI001E5838A2|nr:hypothetical protein [Streptomyces parvulus]MCC9154908.1 hypothetical protein [Streptomyces parvulus]MCE7691247.1 hypothetical protein [Streptomyces parvulus]
MPLQQFTDAELQAKAEELGLVKPGEPIPTAAMQSRVKAAVVEDRRATTRQEKPADARLAKSIVVQPGGVILIDGEPMPWLVAKQPMDIGLNPEGISTVRLTLLAESVQVLKPKTDSPESE